MCVETGESGLPDRCHALPSLDSSSASSLSQFTAPLVRGPLRCTSGAVKAEEVTIDPRARYCLAVLEGDRAVVKIH